MTGDRVALILASMLILMINFQTDLNLGKLTYHTWWDLLCAASINVLTSAGPFVLPPRPPDYNCTGLTLALAPSRALSAMSSRCSCYASPSSLRCMSTT